MSEQIRTFPIIAVVGIVAIVGLVMMVKPTHQHSEVQPISSQGLDERNNIAGQADSTGSQGYQTPDCRKDCNDAYADCMRPANHDPKACTDAHDACTKGCKSTSGSVW